jgi:Anti-sigma-K factor rskA
MSETGPQNSPDEALVDLLIKQVTEGLSPAEQRELERLDSASASRYLRDLERAAAAVTLAGSAPEPMPPALQARLEKQALDFAATAGRGAGDNVVDLNRAKSAAAPPASARRGAAGWWAAAACLLLALFAWLRSPEPAPVANQPAPPVAAPPAVVAPAPPTPAEERAALLARSESLKLTMGATKDPAAAGVTGDVVWDPVTQQGYLRFVGLPQNDPKLHQYQLWIFDATRDQRYPVDGGVFDVPGNSSEVLVPIHARLPIRSAAAFAVTLEKSGGAVVSAREHILVLAKAG